jgi:hypothetical protein
MIIKVDKILLDSPLAAGMIGGVRIAESGLTWNLKDTTATAISTAQGQFGSPTLWWMTSRQTTPELAQWAGTYGGGNLAVSTISVLSWDRRRDW